MKTYLKCVLHTVFLFLGGLSFTLQARELPELNSSVVDVPGLLDFSFRKRLELALKSYQKENNLRLQIVILESLEGDTIQQFSQRLLDEKLSSIHPQSALFLLSLSDRQLQVMPASGLSSLWPSKLSQQIVDTAVPFLKKNAYESAILISLHQMAEASGAPLQNLELYRKRRSYRQYDWLIIVILLFLIALFGRSFSRRSRWAYLSHLDQATNRSKLDQQDLSVRGRW